LIRLRRCDARRSTCPSAFESFAETLPFVSKSYRQLANAALIEEIIAFLRNNVWPRRSHTVFLLTSMLVRHFTGRMRIDKAYRQDMSLDKIFSLDPSWPREKARAYVLEQYRNYIRIVHAVAERFNVKSAFFIQAVPGTGKPLNREEETVVGDISYGPAYRGMAANMMSLGDEGVEIHHLLDLFEDVPDKIYIDSGHCYRDSVNGESRGYRMMAKAVGDMVAESWRLKRIGEQ